MTDKVVFAENLSIYCPVASEKVSSASADGPVPLICGGALNPELSHAVSLRLLPEE